MKTFRGFIEEAKQGHALVVGGKVVARGSKKQLLKKVKKTELRLIIRKTFWPILVKKLGIIGRRKC